MIQSVEADLPPAVEETMKLMQKELRHLKGSRLTSGKRSCVEKGSNKACQDHNLTAKPCRHSNLTQGRPKEPSVGPQIIPRKEKLVKVDKLGFSLMKMNPALINGERAFIKCPGSC
jgi:hypothetical protein